MLINENKLLDFARTRQLYSSPGIGIMVLAISLPAYICVGYAECEAMPLLGRASLVHLKELRQEEGNNGDFVHGPRF